MAVDFNRFEGAHGSAVTSVGIFLTFRIATQRATQKSENTKKSEDKYREGLRWSRSRQELPARPAPVP